MGKQMCAIAAAVVVAGAAVLVSVRPTVGQPAAAAPPGVGRVQLQTTGAAPNSTAFVIDTQTGRVWYRGTVDKAWTDMGTPGEPAAGR